MKKDTIKNRLKKIIPIAFALILAATVFCVPAFAAGNVSGVIEDTWNAARSQLQEVVDNVVFPVLDVILAILFFVKLGGTYFDCAPVMAM